MSEQAGHRRGVWPLVTAAEMQALDRATIDVAGIPGEVLMESAGRALATAVMSLAGRSARPQASIRVVCGAGNNGGDGFVLARHLHQEGVGVEVVLVGDPERLAGDASRNWSRLPATGVARRVVDPTDGDFDWAARFDASSVAVDALFGTGLVRPLGGGYARVVEALNAARARGLKVVAVDVPSGIGSDTGVVLGVAVEADRTVTISLPKIGLALEPGAAHAGEITVARVGIADPDPARRPRAELWTRRGAAAHFPPRPRAGHKGSFGHVLVIAGSTGKLGAGALSSRAASRAGAGLVTLAHPIGIEAELAALPAEVMSAPIAATAEGHLALAGQKAVEELAAQRDAVALGPGIGTGSEAFELARRLVAGLDRPLVLDADGLNALVGQLDVLRERRAPTILTPHPGEAARLLDSTASRLNADRLGAARELAERTGAVAVLKGARTVVADPGGRAMVVPTGGPQLATGGTGDVLTGIVAALAASGLEPFEAAGLAAWWHGATADRLPAARVGFGLLASELADALPSVAGELIGSLRASAEEDTGGFLDLRFPDA